MLIDVHAHLDFPQFDSDRSEVIERAKNKNIIIVNSIVDPVSIEKSMNFNYDNVFMTIGLSPAKTDKSNLEAVLDQIRQYKDRIVGIGEVGLDYYWVKEPEKRLFQKESLVRFIEIGKETGLRLVLHSRDAESDIIDILDKNKTGAILHCFSGGVELAKKAISLGCLISIPTSVIYSKQKQELVKSIPIDSIVIESDAPFLAPVPKARNEPMNIVESVRKISELKNIDEGEIEKITTNNAIKFFNLQETFQ